MPDNQQAEQISDRKDQPQNKQQYAGQSVGQGVRSPQEAEEIKKKSQEYQQEDNETANEKRQTTGSTSSQGL